MARKIRIEFTSDYIKQVIIYIKQKTEPYKDIKPKINKKLNKK